MEKVKKVNQEETKAIAIPIKAKTEIIKKQKEVKQYLSEMNTQLSIYITGLADGLGIDTEVNSFNMVTYNFEPKQKEIVK